jgi:hypothetical protein
VPIENRLDSNHLIFYQQLVIIGGIGIGGGSPNRRDEDWYLA